MFELLLNNNFLSSVIAFAIILIPAIIIHEFGHFIAAKIIGINVLEFGIGFPPRALRLFVWGETEFTLNWLPIGGFVRPLGEDMIGPVDDKAPTEQFENSSEDKQKRDFYYTEREELMRRGVPEDRLLSVNEAKPLGRIFFMVGGAAANVLSAMVFLMFAALSGIPSEIGARVQIANIPGGSEFDRAEVVLGDAIEQINGRLFSNSDEFFQIWGSLVGEQVELSLRHPDDFEDETLAGQAYTITVTPQSADFTPAVLVIAMIESAPAYQSGIRLGDRIVAIDGQPLSRVDPVTEIQRASETYAGIGVNLTVLRGNETLDFFVTPRVNPPPSEGRIGIGIRAQYEFSNGIYFQNTDPQFALVPQDLGASMQYSWARTTETFGLIASIPGQIISGAISPEEARPVSVIGISQIGGQFLQRSIRDGSPSMLLEFLALISIFLGITNLLPFPPLDGGRIVFVLIEMVSGKPVPFHIENLVYRIGMVLLLGLGLIVIIYDIINPFV